DHYGSHLDENGRTPDEDMEQNNFAYAGKTLAEIWSSISIDSYPVTATHVDSGEPDFLDYDMDCIRSTCRRSQLSARTCGSCGLYHASQKSANRHKKSVHGEKSHKDCLVRPLRIVAHRANELMCVIKYVEGMEDAEWINEEVCQDSFREESDEVVTEGGSNIITDMENWLQQPWSTSE
ncbi:hypothetical protein AVEN_141432-1, partial [Araneus ventricosus]